MNVTPTLTLYRLDGKPVPAARSARLLKAHGIRLARRLRRELAAKGFTTLQRPEAYEMAGMRSHYEGPFRVVEQYRVMNDDFKISVDVYVVDER